MTLSSMTGFATVSEIYDGYNIRIDIKSVNGKGQDIRVRVPTAYDGFDLVLKKRAAAALDRGTITISLSLERTTAGGTLNLINHDYLAALKLELEVHTLLGVNVDRLLTVPGVLKTDNAPELSSALKEKLELMLGQAIQQLKTVRASEGAEIAGVLAVTIDDLQALVDKARTTASQREPAIEDRFQKLLNRVSAVANNVDEERLAQELAHMAVKIDVTEELDRLDAHIKAVRDGLAGDGPIGRRFDFLAQELVRETNTLCSKSQDKDLTAVGLDMKTLIDQFREQALNIE